MVRPRRLLSGLAARRDHGSEGEDRLHRHEHAPVAKSRTIAGHIRNIRQSRERENAETDILTSIICGALQCTAVGSENNGVLLVW